uniref:Uncharacterized protein n=1 Tax=Solibacter usitatus (strain Ellin6076) TaxID=234267 RepID=Q024E2_SOLUE
MATPAQVTANRANAQLSTGPRSVEGKAAASRNSFKLGLNAQSLIIPGEDIAGLEELTAAHEQKFQPVGPVETELLETVIRSAWMKRRYARIETEYLGARIAALPEGTEYPLGAVMVQDVANGNTMQKIFRRQQAAQRDWYKAIETLTRLQASRRHAELEAALRLPPPSSLMTPPPNRVRFDSPPQPAPRPAAEPPVNLALRL